MPTPAEYAPNYIGFRYCSIYFERFRMVFTWILQLSSRRSMIYDPPFCWSEAIRMVQGAREAVMSYIKALDDRDYAAARNYLGNNVRVKGPGGETFRSPDEFLKMMEQQRGKYDIKKVFVDGSDVCLLYDFITPQVTTFFCSWYQVKNGKISSIQTVFDSRAFAAQ